MKIFENFYSFRKYFFWTIFSLNVFLCYQIFFWLYWLLTHILFRISVCWNQLRYPPDHGYVLMAMLLPPVDYQDLLWRICSYGHALPTVDTPSARTFYDGYALMDTIILNCGYASIKDWIFNFMGKDLIHNLKKMKPQVNVFIFMSGSYSQKIAWNWDKRGSPRLVVYEHT